VSRRSRRRRRRGRLRPPAPRPPARSSARPPARLGPRPAPPGPRGPARRRSPAARPAPSPARGRPPRRARRAGPGAARGSAAAARGGAPTGCRRIATRYLRHAGRDPGRRGNRAIRADSGPTFIQRPHIGPSTTKAAAPRRLAAACLAGLALAAAGCGGDDEAKDKAKAKAPAAATPAPRVFQGQEVADFFREVTGDPLEFDAGGAASFDSLSLDRSDYDRSGTFSERYGFFIAYVLKDPADKRLYEVNDNQPVAPDPNGIYWHRDGGSYRALKPYGGGSVVLDWSAEDGRVVDERFERLDTVLSQLGKPVEEARAALPPEDQPCDAPAAGETCRDADGVTVTTVERDQRLKLPGLQVKVVKVDSGRVVVPGNRLRYGLAKRAKGIFILAIVKLRNTGDEPLDSLYDARLRIGDRTYDQDTTAGYTVTPPNAFPIQPGDNGAAGVVFDVPRSAAKQALREGAIAFPAGEEDFNVEDAFRIGQIRLGRPLSTAGGEETRAS